MEINNLLFNYIRQSIPKEILTRNSILEGEIISLEDGLVYLNLDGEILRAKSDLDLSQYVGEKISFIIRDRTDEQIVIQPVTQDTIEKISREMETTVDKVVKEFNLEKTPKIEKLISSFINNKLTLNKENVEKGVKILEKLDQLMNLEDEELEILDLKKDNFYGLDPSKKKEDKAMEGALEIKAGEIEQVGKLLNIKDLDPTSLNEEDLNLIKNLQIPPKILRELFGWEKTKNILKFIEKMNFPSMEKISLENESLLAGNLSKENIEFLRGVLSKVPLKEEFTVDIRKIILRDTISSGESVNKDVKEFLNLDYKPSDRELVQLTSFLLKNKIRPSLNNIRGVLQLIKEPDKFMGKLKYLSDNINNKDFIELLRKSAMEEKLGLRDKNILSEIYKNSATSEDVRREVLDLKGRIEFIRDLNKEIYFNSIPFNYGEDKLSGFLNVMEEKESRSGGKNPLNVYINLDTKNLGNIRASCLVYKQDLLIRLGINREDVEIFRSLEKTFITRLGNLNYRVKSLDYVYREEVGIIDEISKSDSLYFLDIRV